MWKLWWLRWWLWQWLRRWLRWWLWWWLQQLQQLQVLPGGLLQQLLPLLLRLLWGLLQRPCGLLPPPHLQLPLVWLRWWEGLLPAEELLLPAEVQLPEAMLPLGELLCRCCWASACSHSAGSGSTASIHLSALHCLSAP